MENNNNQAQTKTPLFIIFLFFFFNGYYIFSTIAFIVAYISREHTEKGTNMYDYYTYNIRTFFLTIFYGICLMIMSFVFMDSIFLSLPIVIFFPISLLLLLIWHYSRIIYVFVKALNDQPLANAKTWWI